MAKIEWFIIGWTDNNRPIFWPFFSIIYSSSNNFVSPYFAYFSMFTLSFYTRPCKTNIYTPLPLSSVNMEM